MGSRGGFRRRSCVLRQRIILCEKQVQFSRPITGYQLTQLKLVDMGAQLVTGQLLAMHLANLKDAGKLTPIQVSLGKRQNVASALDIARTARGILGGNGVSAEYPIMRHAANLESVYTYEGTHEVQRWRSAVHWPD